MAALFRRATTKSMIARSRSCDCIPTRYPKRNREVEGRVFVSLRAQQSNLGPLEAPWDEIASSPAAPRNDGRRERWSAAFCPVVPGGGEVEFLRAAEHFAAHVPQFRVHRLLEQLVGGGPQIPQSGRSARSGLGA